PEPAIRKPCAPPEPVRHEPHPKRPAPRLRPLPRRRTVAVRFRLLRSAGACATDLGKLARCSPVLPGRGPRLLQLAHARPPHLAVPPRAGRLPSAIRPRPYSGVPPSLSMLSVRWSARLALPTASRSARARSIATA